MKAKKIPQIGNLVKLRYFNSYESDEPLGVPFYGIVFAVESLHDPNETVIRVFVLKANHSHCHIWNKFDEVLS